MSKWAVSICPSGHFLSTLIALGVRVPLNGVPWTLFATRTRRKERWREVPQGKGGGPGYARLSISDGLPCRRLRRCKRMEEKFAEAAISLVCLFVLFALYEVKGKGRERRRRRRKARRILYPL
ncbi:hypothetical protein HDV57DRAFT_290023 [Trichoderma longibrachiatum]